MKAIELSSELKNNLKKLTNEIFLEIKKYDMSQEIKKNLTIEDVIDFISTTYRTWLFFNKKGCKFDNFSSIKEEDKFNEFLEFATFKVYDLIK